MNSWLRSVSLAAVTDRLRHGGWLRILKNASWLAMARAGADLLAFVMFVAISRRYGPEGTGTYTFALAIAGVVAIIANPALTDYGIRALSRATESARGRVFRALLAVQGVFVLAAVIAALSAAAWLADAATRPVVLALSLYLASMAVAWTLFVPAYAQEAMRLPAIVEVLTRLLATVLALTLVLLTDSPLVVALIGCPFAGIGALLLAARLARAGVGSLRPSLAGVSLGRLALEVAPFAITEVAGQLYARVDVIVLTTSHGSAATGVYAPALKLAEVGTAPLMLLVMAAFPALSRTSHTEPERFAVLAGEVLRVNLFLGGLIALGFIFVLPELAVPLLGPRFAPTVDFLPWAGLFAALQAAEIVLLRLLLATDLQTRAMRALIAGALCNLALNLALIPAFGAAGAMAAVLASLVLLTAIYGWSLRDRLPLRLPGRMIGSAAAALAAAVAVGELARAVVGMPFAAFATASIAFLLLAALFDLLPARGVLRVLRGG